MADISRRPTPGWVPWLVAVVVLVMLGLVWAGWQNARRVALDADVDIVRPSIPDLPPRVPDAPRLPDAPIPTPK